MKGGHYEVTGSTVTKYYFAGTSRIAMRKYTIPQAMTVEYFLGDHLGSTSITTDMNGAKVSEMRYKPCPLRCSTGVLREGEVRYSWTSKVTTTPSYVMTKYTFTGQFSNVNDFGLMFYNSRWYDSSLGRFAQADTIVPSNIHGYDRFNYVSNRPTINTDPTGHMEWNEKEGARSKPPCAKEPSKNEKSNMNNISISIASSMETYVSASIAVQNPHKNRGWLVDVLTGQYTGEGPAKVSDAEMEHGYGDPINNGDNRYGLGLRNPGATTPDQNDLTVAVTAMRTRIQVRLDACQKTRFSCTLTDVFLAAALGGDGAIAPGDLKDLGNGKIYGKPDENGIFPWNGYLSDPGLDDPDHDRKIIQQFVNNVYYLEQQGAAVPNINWTYVCGLLKE